MRPAGIRSPRRPSCFPRSPTRCGTTGGWRPATGRAAALEALAAAGEPDGQGRVTVTLPVESYDVAYSQLIALGPEGELLAPQEVRERFAAAAARMVRLYDAGEVSGRER